MTYTIPQLCERWSWSDDTIRRLIKAKRLRALPRTGPRGSYRFTAEEVARFETRRAPKSRSLRPLGIPDELGLYERGPLSAGGARVR
jgi:excisionase family DNA binding protein